MDFIFIHVCWIAIKCLYHTIDSSMQWVITIGSCLGWIYYSLFSHINDLSSAVNSQCLIFTDDIKLYRPIHSDNDVFQLQRVLDTLCMWMHGMLGGSHCLTFLNVHSYPLVITLILLANYLMKTFHLENVEYAKDLGVTIDSQLKFHQHCSTVI